MKEHRRRVVITGAGVLSSLGDSPEALHQALLSGARGIRPIESFSTDGLPCRRAGEIPEFAPEAYLGERANLRPLDRTGRLVTAAAALALEASGWTEERRREDEVGLVLGTMFGSVHTISEFDRRALEAGPIYVKPFQFANSVINAAAGQAAIWHHLRGANATVAGGTTAGLQALAYAADLVRAGRAQAILAGGADEFCFESFFGFARAGLLCPCRNGGEAVPVPFHPRRAGFALGEGAALFMLEEAGAALARGARILGEIRGSGASFDPSRGEDEASAAQAMARAVRLALADAGLPPEEIQALSASARGSPTLDRVEALGVAAALGETIRRLAVAAVKSGLGECLGASGALEVLTLLESFRTGLLPGIRGLDQVEEGLPLPQIGAESRRIDLRHGLVTTLGLDGQTCALVVGRYEEGS